ncbi:hypothetical protein BO71DRAFT_479008 [Aspergillus ellipticus CBS 707.79]|uniref:Uncharacterized protein n=1 Tax=Aspergillus ellipticus CBS 707.79 TaxID=1448320 RepID=A0A319E146_9EURO|nr:hypothetical protein BO71DRAFT_479008 [Aspergillus ellipticus CBS 707.79]
MHVQDVSLTTVATNNPPPAYTPGEALPSYDELVRRYEKIEVLVAGIPIEEPPVGGDATLKTFKTRASSTPTQEFMEEQLKSAAENATEAALRLRTMFNEIHLKAIEIDKIHHSGFEPSVRRHKQVGSPLWEHVYSPCQCVREPASNWAAQEFDSILNLSRLVAIEIQNLGTSFDVRIIPICLDDDVPIDSKKTRVAEFLAVSEFQASEQSARDHAIKSKDIKDKLKLPKPDFTSVVGNFETWANNKEGDLEREIAELLRDLDDMKVELAKIDDKINIIKAARAISGILLLHCPWGICEFLLLLVSE